MCGIIECRCADLAGKISLYIDPMLQHDYNHIGIVSQMGALDLLQ